MAKARTQARCDRCGHTEPKWVGQCPGCHAWGSLVEEALTAVAGGSSGALAAGADPARMRAAAAAPARPIREVPADRHQRAVTGIAELDRVLGGGLVPGSVTLFGGEPGAGKSTLLLQAADALARRGRRVLYVSAEESAGQVRLRAERLDALADGLLLASETDLGVVVGLVEHHDPDVLVVDSIQTVRLEELGGAAGGVAQVRDCAAVLTRLAKRRDLATLLVGHVTKDGQLAGPRVLEHLVDTVCEFDGDRHHALRLLRAHKNRFGAVGEVGCFEMTGSGLVGVEDAGRLFVGETAEDTTGIAVTLTLEGRRPLACEVQALVTATSLPQPRRIASGLDAQRLSVLAAVLERRADLRLATFDMFTSTVGGLRLAEPAADLALCLALASSRLDVAVPRRLIAVGEVGLAGEVRMATQIQRRLEEAARLGFTGALLPPAYDGPAFGLRLHPVPDLRAALAVGLG